LAIPEGVFRKFGNNLMKLNSLASETGIHRTRDTAFKPLPALKYFFDLAPV